MQMNLAIKTLAIIVLYCSCSASKHECSNDINYLINNELSRNVSLIGRQKAYLEFNQNDYMHEFLLHTKNNLQNSSTIKNSMGKEIFEHIFNLEELDYLIRQTYQSNDFNYDELKLNRNIVYISKNNAEHKDPIDMLSRAYIFLSKPIFTKNNAFSLVAFSNGVKGEMQGGVSIYKNDAENWKFVATINDWVE